MEMTTETTQNDTKRPPIWVFILAFSVILMFLSIIARSMFGAERVPISMGDKAPEFKLTTFNGEEIYSADLVGNIVLVNFWASWCNPCQQEAEDMEAAWQYYKDSGDIIFLGVDYVDSEEEALEFLETYKISYPNGPDIQSEISDSYRVTGVPETFIINKSGKLVYIKIGPFNSVDEIKNLLDGVIELENIEN